MLAQSKKKKTTYRSEKKMRLFSYICSISFAALCSFFYV